MREGILPQWQKLSWLLFASVLPAVMSRFFVSVDVAWVQRLELLTAYNSTCVRIPMLAPATSSLANSRTASS
jgi:hypothetical protein